MRAGTTFTVQPAGTSFLGIQGVTTRLVRAESRSILSTVLVAGASPVASGGLIVEPQSSARFLVAAVNSPRINGVAQLSELTCLKTNASVTIKRLVAGAWSTVGTAIACTLLRHQASDPSDKSLMVSQYTGSSVVVYGHFQASVGLQVGDQVIDGSRVYLVGHDIDPTSLPGLVIARLDLRTS